MRNRHRFDLCEGFFWLLFLGLAGLCALISSGCQLEKGTQTRAGATGIMLEPLGSAPNMPRLIIGTGSRAYSAEASVDAGPQLNRGQIDATWSGVRETTTIAAGPVGREIEQAGDVLPRALEVLHTPLTAPEPEAP